MENFPPNTNEFTVKGNFVICLGIFFAYVGVTICDVILSWSIRNQNRFSFVVSTLEWRRSMQVVVWSYRDKSEVMLSVCFVLEVKK